MAPKRKAAPAKISAPAEDTEVSSKKVKRTGPVRASTVKAAAKVVASQPPTKVVKAQPPPKSPPKKKPAAKPAKSKAPTKTAPKAKAAPKKKAAKKEETPTPPSSPGSEPESADGEASPPSSPLESPMAEEEDIKATSVPKHIVIEHCKQCNSFKTRALKIEEALKEAYPDIKISINPDKPRKGCFEIREEGGQTFISLLDMPRPFRKMKDTNMDELAADIVAKLKE